MGNENFYGNSSGSAGTNYNGNTQNPASGPAQKEDFQKYFNILNNLNKQHEGTAQTNNTVQNEMPSLQASAPAASDTPAGQGQPSYTEYRSSRSTAAETPAQPSYTQYSTSGTQQNYSSSSTPQYSAGQNSNASANQYTAYGSQQNNSSSSSMYSAGQNSTAYANQYTAYGSQQNNSNYSSMYSAGQNSTTSANQYPAYNSQRNNSGSSYMQSADMNSTFSANQYSSYGSSYVSGTTYANDRSTSSSYQNQSYESGYYNQPLSSGSSYSNDSYSSGFSGFSSSPTLTGYLLGFLGAVIGAIPGVLLITFLGNIGYAACVSGIVLFFCVFLLYRKLSGAGDSFSKADWSIVIGVCVISVYIAVKCSYSMKISSALGGELSFGEVYGNFSEILELAQIKGKFIFSLVITYLCTFVGAARSIGSFGR